RPVETRTLFGRWLSRWRNQDKPRSVALFRQMKRRGRRFDLLEFPDGHLLPVASLYDGQTATVLQLPAPPASQQKTRRKRGKRVGEDSQSLSKRESNETRIHAVKVTA